MRLVHVYLGLFAVPDLLTDFPSALLVVILFILFFSPEPCVLEHSKPIVPLLAGVIIYDALADSPLQYRDSAVNIPSGTVIAVWS